MPGLATPPRVDAGLRPRTAALVAAALYFGMALFAMRVVLSAPATLLPYPKHFKGGVLAIDDTDQRFVVAGVYRNALGMLRAPWDLLDNRQCFPMPRAITLGEHMYGNGLLGVVPALLSGDPIVTYNAVVVLTLWIPALTMYALVRYWTGSVAAALVAGFLFAFQPARIGDPNHPFVHGDLWTPLVLLFAHRVFREGSLAATAALATALALQLLESIYPLVALAVLGAVYGPYLLLRHLRVLPRRLPQILAVVAVTVAVAVMVLGPYLRAREVWGILEGRGSFLLEPRLFLPGHYYYPGTVMLLLALVGVVDRLRGPRAAQGYDPRWVMLAAGLLVFWMVVWGISIPGIGHLPSPYLWLANYVPGLRAVRAFPAARTGLYLALCFLAGYGVLAVTAGRGPRVQAAVALVLLALISLEIFPQRVGDLMLGVTPVPLGGRRAAPPPALREALVEQLPPGAVLDLPFRGTANEPVALVAMSHAILLGAYHQRPVAACYNSFVSPIVADVSGMAARLPEPDALTALRAVGFGSVVVHREQLRAGEGAQASRMHAAAVLAAAGRPAAGPVHLEVVAQVDDHVLYRLVGDVDPDRSLAPLASGPAADEAVDVPPAGGAVPFRFRNAGSRPYRHPDPIEPTALVLRWMPQDGGVPAVTEARTLLPVALAPGEETVRKITVPPGPAPGRYEVALAPAASPDVVLARTRVQVLGVLEPGREGA